MRRFQKSWRFHKRMTNAPESPCRSTRPASDSSPLAVLRKVAQKFGLLAPESQAHPDPLLCQRGEQPATEKWWTLLPLEPRKYQRAIVFDTETSGFGADDEILEIGAVEFEVCPPHSSMGTFSSFRPTGKCFHSLLRPTRPINAKASEVNGLYFDEMQAAASRPHTLRSFMQFAAGENTALVAHNAAFDLRMMLQDLKRCGLEGEGIRLGQRCFCSAAAFAAFRRVTNQSDGPSFDAPSFASIALWRPSSPRDLTSACLENDSLSDDRRCFDCKGCACDFFQIGESGR
ncbi:unnamed protein product [Durusdinium trenchii]|uniref:Exonuclease domain-containing protein n=1 Tax=Durusdinium trenchii TaxID=1381693 RepID=A0ABP0NMH7_9DINO